MFLYRNKDNHPCNREFRRRTYFSTQADAAVNAKKSQGTLTTTRVINNSFLLFNLHRSAKLPRRFSQTPPKWVGEELLKSARATRAFDCRLLQHCFPIGSIKREQSPSP